jgi:DCN1-like protein 1/2
LLAPDLATAVAYWNLLLKGRFTHLDDWLTFIQVRKNVSAGSERVHGFVHRCVPCPYTRAQEHHKKAVQRDTWNLLLDFSRTVKDDLSDYDADGMACSARCSDELHVG